MNLLERVTKLELSAGGGECLVCTPIPIIEVLPGDPDPPDPPRCCDRPVRMIVVYLPTDPEEENNDDRSN